MKNPKSPTPEQGEFKNSSQGGENGQGSSQLFPSIDTIVTPEMATRWLGNNQSPRGTNDLRVAMYTRQHLSGQFPYTGMAVHLGEKDPSTGVEALYNGVHRLKAIVRSGKPMTLPLVYNYPKELLPFLDIGKSRTAADYLHPPMKAAIGRYLYCFERRIKPYSRGISPPDVVLTFKRHERSGFWSSEFNRMRRLKHSGIVAACYWILETKHPLGGEFVGGLMDPSGLSVGDRINRLRMYLLDPNHGLSRSGEGPRIKTAWLIFDQWRRFSNNLPPNEIQMKSDIRLLSFSWPGGAPYLGSEIVAAGPNS